MKKISSEELEKMVTPRKKRRSAFTNAVLDLKVGENLFVPRNELTKTPPNIMLWNIKTNVVPNAGLDFKIQEVVRRNAVVITRTA